MTTQKGRYAEQIATQFLRHHGVALLYRNYRSPYGEIDIIGSELEYILFVEVRARRTAQFLRPIDTISGQKKRRILNTAMHFLMHQDRRCSLPCRFDVIELIAPDLASQQVYWHKNAFDLSASS